MSGRPRRWHWHGTLLEDKRNETGTYYRRNRTYDPSSGRFTQEAPIGLAGGLNAYGFAAGNPVSYSDPYGLCPYEGNERTTNVDDCPDDEWKPVFMQLSQNRIGRSTIDQVVRLRLGVRVTHDCGAGPDGCTDYMQGDILIRPGNVSAMASTVVHEVVHLVIHGEEAKAAHLAPPSGWWQEAAAFGAGFNYFLHLPRSQRTDRTLNYFTERFQRDPGGALRTICASSYSSKGCP